MKSNTIEVKATGWRFKFTEPFIRGINYLKAEDTVQFNGSLADINVQY